MSEAFRPTFEQIQLLKKFAALGLGKEAELSALCKEADCSWNEAYMMADIHGVLSLRPVHCEGRLYASITERGLKFLERETA